MYNDFVLTSNHRLLENEQICFSFGEVSREIGVGEDSKIKIINCANLNITFANNIISEEIVAKYLADVGATIANPLLINV